MQKEKKEDGGQFVPLTGNLPKPPKLPFFSGLRHLIVKTSRMCHMTRQLVHFRALRTLSLEAVNANQPLRMALDVTALTELKHLAIHNFCMDSIAAPQGCKLHARWTGNNNSGLARQQGHNGWLCSSMWQRMKVPLVSFSLQVRSRDKFLAASLAALESIVSRGRPLEYLCLINCWLVNAYTPLEISEHRWRGILKARTLRLVTSGTLAELLLGDCPSWERLSWEAGEAEIDLRCDSMGSLLAGLREFNICGKPRAPLALQLGAEMARGGRPCHAVMCASQVSQGVYHVTNLFADAWRSFDEAMSCGCQCCLLCLRRGGVLPAGFSVGRDDGNSADSGGEYDDDEDDEDEPSSSSWESEDEEYSSDD